MQLLFLCGLGLSVLQSQGECCFAFGTHFDYKSCMLSPAKEYNVAWRVTRRQLQLQCSCELMGDENACIPFHSQSLYTFDVSYSYQLYASDCFLTTKVNMVFFSDLDTPVNSDCRKFGACVWPMGQIFTVPAFVPPLVGCVELKGIN